MLSLLFITIPALASMDGHHDHHAVPEMEAAPEMMELMEAIENPPMEKMHNFDVHSDDFTVHHFAPDPATERYMHIHHTMHDAMDINFSGDPDLDFLAGMIPHHQGAVDMAMVQLRYGRNGNVRGFANKVIRDQKREIKLMKDLINTIAYERGENILRDPIATRKSKMVNHMMHQNMMIDYTGESDVDFMVGMIPHHQGALDMARVVLEHGKDRRVKQLAQQILSAQVGEIYGMKLWLRRAGVR